MQDINIIDYTLYNLGFHGDTLFTSCRLDQENPDLRVKMIRASLLGWQYAMAHPKEAVNIVLKYDKSDQLTREHQLSIMKEIPGLVKVPWQKVGYIDQTTVQQMMNTLLRYKVLEGPLQPKQVYTNIFWEQAQKE